MDRSGHDRLSSVRLGRPGRSAGVARGLARVAVVVALAFSVATAQVEGEGADPDPVSTPLVDTPAEEILEAARHPSSEQGLPAVLGRADVQRGLDQAVDHLLAAQNEDGSWGSWANPESEFWSNPYSHYSWIAATTGLAVMALMEQEDRSEVEDAVDRGLDFLLEQPPLKRPSDWDVDNTWGLVYGLDSVVGALRHPRLEKDGRVPRLRAKAELFIAQLEETQSVSGGWGYYDFETRAARPSWATSFQTAVALLALLGARDLGLEMDDTVIPRATAALERCLLPTGAYTYSVMAVPGPGGLERINQVKGSLGRIQVCNLALVLAGSERVTHDMLLDGLDAFFEHHRFLDVARKKPYPHEAYYQNSGYFYFFGHYYAARVLELLTGPERARFETRLAREILKTQESDGSMWDYYMNSYHRSYGTAFGAMTLQRTLPRG